MYEWFYSTILNTKNFKGIPFFFNIGFKWLPIILILVFLYFCLYILFFLLKFLFIHPPVAPICRPGQIITYNVGRGEIAKINCEVEANPTDVQFVWKFNTSVLETLDMPSSNIMNDRSKSIAHYKPMTEHVIWNLIQIDTKKKPSRELRKLSSHSLSDGCYFFFVDLTNKYVHILYHFVICFKHIYIVYCCFLFVWKNKILIFFRSPFYGFNFNFPIFFKKEIRGFFFCSCCLVVHNTHSVWTNT